MVTPFLLEALPPPAEPPPSSEVTPLAQEDRTGTATAVPARAPRRVRRFISEFPVSLGGAVAEEEALEGREAQVEHDGYDGDEHLHEVALGESVEDEAAEAAEGDVGGDGGRGDHLDEREPQAGHDQGEREGQLDLEQHLVAAHALAARRVLDVRV